MKKDEIHGVLNDHFKKIDKYFHKIMKEFEEEDIHMFRVEIKKLRSFLHLVEMEKEEGIHFNTAKKLKTIYGYVGITRNLQLQIKLIRESVKDGDALPSEYLNKLKKELGEWQNKIRDYMGEENNFYDEEELLRARMPDKLKKKSITQYIRFMLYKLNGLMNHLFDDEALHGVRKILKDFHYNRSFIEIHLAPLPKGIADEKATKSCMDLIGLFHDKCIAHALLQTYNDESVINEEKEFLQKIEQKWEREKEGLKQKIDSKLKVLELTAQKINSFSFVDTSVT